MRFMFVNHVSKSAGSAQAILGYMQAANALGHEVVLYGPQRKSSVFRYSQDVESSDVVVLILEWWYRLHHGGHLNLVKLISGAPRHRRIVIDCDGMYNDVIRVDGDYNHPDIAASRQRIELCESLADKIYQPTLHPLRPNVRSFLFYAYSPDWGQQLHFRDKPYGMCYVGNNWFRWNAMQRVLRAIEPIRSQVGPIGIVGYGWDGRANWVEPPLRDDAYRTDVGYLERLNVQLMPAVAVKQVIQTMGQGIFSPILTRPLFNYLRLVTPRMFETAAANTIPLFDLDEAYVREIYGPAALELVLGDDATERIADVLRRPDYYASIIFEIRRCLAEKHSYPHRIQELITMVTN
jgi:Glycosyl transferases group 1